MRPMVRGMGTRTIIVLGAIGAVLFGLAAFAFTGGGGKSGVPEAAKASSSSSSSGVANATTSSGGPTPGSANASSTTDDTANLASDQGAVTPLTPPVPPDESEFVVNGGHRFSTPLRSWTKIGERFGAPRSDGRILGGINFLFAGKTNDVITSCSGYVQGISEDKIYGKYVVVDCNEGWLTLYANLSEIKTRNRADVLQGETVLATATDMLHFEIRWRRIPVNPEPFLDFNAVAGQPRPTPVSRGATPEATPSASPSVTSSPTKTPTKTPTQSSSGGGSTSDEPTVAPEATSAPATATPARPTSTATPVPPTPTPANTPTPLPPVPTRTPTPKPVLY